jgi:ferredoxin-NADP reductase/DMSO/TMAO reductase YedYZ heme-binding membrane subunit
MLALVTSMIPARRAPARNLVDATVWWYAARASGLVAWILLGTSVMGGLLLTTQLTQGRTRAWTQSLHEFIGVLAVAFTVVHLATVLAADQLRIGLRHLLIPFTKPDNPLAQGYGVLAVYLLTAVMLTSWARVSLPWRWWRRLHLLAFPVFGFASAHTVLAGTDTGNPIMYWAGLVTGAVMLFLAVLRLLTSRHPPRAPAAGSRLPTSAAVPGVPAQRRASLSAAPPTAAPPARTLGTAGAGMSLLIGQTTWEADNVMSLRLHSPDRALLPSWEPGAHIELALPSGRLRQYSLCSDPDDLRSYRIAVLQVPTGRGGSVEVHTGARAGQLIAVQGPRNHFPLGPSSGYLFIAGGIGITAMLAMAARVASTGKEWKLLYTGRRRAGMAFIDEIRALGPDRVKVVPGDECGRPNLGELIGSVSAGTAVYCCGPSRLLSAVREQVDARPDLSLHSELFTGELFTGGSPTGGAAFHVKLHRTGQVIAVPGDRSVLQAVRDVLPDVPAGCEQGVCGACRTKVLAGEPDHRDNLLSSAERATGAMLICVSRALSEHLILDL